MGKTMRIPNQDKHKNSVSRKRHAIILKLVALPVFALGSSVTLADWYFDPVLRAAWDFDDNATLSPRTDDEIDLSGYIAEASVDFIYKSEMSFFSMRPILRTRDYGSENDDWNADDQFVDIRGFWNGDKNSLRLFGDFSREAIRTAELADADLDTEIDPDDIADDNSGFVSTSQRRTRYRVAPRWTFRSSDVSSFETELSYLSASYDETDDLQRLFDFTDISLRSEYRRDFSPRNSATFGVRIRDYDTDRFANDRQSYEISGGIVRTLSETTQFRAKVGIESVDQEDIPGLPNTTIDPQPTAELTLRRNLETTRFLAQYRKRVSASGRGQLTNRDEINVRFSRDLNEFVTVGLGARAYSLDTISGIANSQDYVQVRGQAVWRMSRSFSLQADYRHTVIDRGDIEGAADSNRFTVWLSWQPNPVGRDDRLRIRF
jgi:hypothetical protein